jgi:glycosyltransferase involved in cell wall biosynthesis
MEEKKILFVLTGGTEWVGGLHYTKSLIKTVKWYGRIKQSSVQVSLLVYDENQKKLIADIAGDIDVLYVYDKDLPATHLPNRLRWWFNRKFNNIFNGRLDDFIIKNGFHFVYPTLPRADFKKYRFAEWIPDFQYRHFPQGSNAQEIDERKSQAAFTCNFAPLIYVSSAHAKKDCEELFPQSKGKIEIMRFCTFTDNIKFTAPLNDLLKKYNIPGKYFIVSNLLAPTKNLKVVIEAVSLLKENGTEVTVVVTGDIHDYRNNGFKNEVFQFISEKNIRNNIIMLGLIDRTDQKQLLANSQAIIQPSRFEGWNTVVEEAKCIGKEIILSDIPVHKEQNPEKAFFFRDNDSQDLSVKLRQVLELHHGAEINSIGISALYKKNIDDFSVDFMNTSLNLDK